MIVREIYCPVYKLPIMVVIFDNEDELNKLKIPNLEQTYPIWGMTLDITGELPYSNDCPRSVYILINTKAISNPLNSLRIGVHEGFHAASMTLRNAGINLSPETEEVYAYYIEWVINEVLICISKSRVKKKK